MFDRLGVAGILGVLLVLGGIALVGYRDPIIAAGIALVLVGGALFVKGLVSGILASMGMGAMMGGDDGMF